MYAGLNLQEIADEFPELRRYTSVGTELTFLEPGSEMLAKNVVGNMTEGQLKIQHDIIGMDRHGVVAVGLSPWDAFEHIERLEHICQIVLASGRKNGI